MPKDLLGGTLVDGIWLESERWVVGVHRRLSGAMVIGIGKPPKRDGVHALPFVRGVAASLENQFPRLSLPEWSAQWRQRDLDASEQAEQGVDSGEGAATSVQMLAPAASRFVGVRLPRLLAFASIFILLPQLVADALVRLFAAPPSLLSLSFQLWMAAATVALFIAYARLVAGFEDVGRLFQYNAVFLRGVSVHSRGGQADAASLRKEPSFHPSSSANHIVIAIAVTPLVVWLGASLIPAPPSGWWGQHLTLFAIRAVTAPLVVAIAFEVQECARLLYRASALRSPLRALLFLQPFFVREPKPDQIELGLVALRELSRLEASGEEISTPRSTVGVAGHGMLLAPRCPCRIAHLEDGTLSVRVPPFDSGGAAAISPGSRPATAAPRLAKSDPRIFTCGDGQPSIALDVVETLDEVFLQLDVGLGESPWMLMGPGFSVEYPPLFTVLSAAPGDDDWFFELHRTSAANAEELIRFAQVAKPASKVEIKGPGGTELVEGSSAGEAGPIRTWQFSYNHRDEPWVQRWYALPLSPQATIVMTAQARRRAWPEMEIGAERVAATFAPTEDR